MLTFFELCGADPDVRFSPFVWRIKLMLAHKDLAYSSETVTFTDKSALEGSGFKTVPVIRHDDTWVSESFTIARYLDQHFPGNPLFETTLAAEQAVLLNNWFDRNIVMPVFPMIVADVFAAIDTDSQKVFRATREPRLGGRKIEDTLEGREEAREAFRANLMPLEKILENNGYLCGDTPAFADYCLMGSLMWPYIVSNFDPVVGSASIKDWRERMFDHFDGLARNAPRAV